MLSKLNLKLIIAITILSAVWLISAAKTNFCWDEAYFIKSSINHNNFIKKIFFDNTNTLSVKSAVNEYLGYTAEHPSLTKLINGLFLAAAQKLNLHGYALLYTYRLANFVLMILLILFIYKLTIAFNKNFTFFFLMISLIFFNPQYHIFTIMATSDFYMFVFSFLCAYFYLLSVKNNTDISLLISALCAGLAGASKINGFFIIPVIFIHSIFFSKKKIKSLLIYCSIPAVTALCFYPVLWFDTYKNIRELLHFFLNHYQNYVLYFGKAYNPQTDFAPFHYPLFFFFGANPLILILFFLYGCFLWLKQKKDSVKTFFIIYITALFAVILKPDTASYDGIKLFAVCYPFFAWIAADTILYLSEKIKDSSLKIIYWNIIFISIFIPFILNFSYPSLYYNIFTGSLKNLDNIGFDIDIRGELTDKEIIEILNEDKRSELKVRLIGQNNEMFEVLNEFKIIDKKIICDFNQIKWDYLILLNHRSLFSENDYYYWNQMPPVLEKHFKNIRLWAVYKNE